MPDPIVREIKAPQMDTGSPRPTVTATDTALSLRYFDFDDSAVQIEFSGALAHYFGPPNDEALHGHPLAAFGLTHYAAFEVDNSRWIKDLRDMNRVHPRHVDSLFDSYRHFVWTFHDTTFECVAESFIVSPSS
ncbi:hypothetical protein [Terricaulis silvestris]|uniref:Uncharacterized protein n=1 Tax=Terricaulis silvestris TaxID=2686094 RepID=A0A6I6MIW7_9CAUL|nr:hypothetical protein [Terricaulis silvestris]QGZ95040.1 hypothetical protein DSM104635_01880 [Terricaulis silvestris]